jgi:DNA-directed RNA polymerase subunit RPC12/RpoP
MKSTTITERYEYKCPWCGKVNVRWSPTPRIVCDRSHLRGRVSCEVIL